MTKEIILWVAPFDSASSIIGVRLNNEIDWTYTNLAVRQEHEKTYVWNYQTGLEVLMPRTRYTLSNDGGQKQLADDLDEMGLLGKHYYVRGSFQSAEWTEHRSIDLSVYYEDTFDVGDFLSDEDALEATAVIQSEHDEAACCALKEAGFDDDLGGDGPCYAAHLYRSEEDEDVRVEL